MNASNQSMFKRFPRISRIGLAALFVTGALDGTSSLAQEVWVGRPSVGDVVRRDAAAVINSMRQAKEAGRKLDNFGQTIHEARMEWYLAEYERGPRYETAKKNLAHLLESKDNHFLFFALLEGASGSSSRGLPGTALRVFTKGPLDDGIPLKAKADFDKWTNAVRQSLGGAASVDDRAVAAALAQNQDIYAAYKIKRDKFEIDKLLERKNLPAVHETFKAVRDGKADDGSAPLILDSPKRIVPMSTYHFGRLPREAGGELRGALNEALKSNELMILQCIYGPVIFEDRHTGVPTIGKARYHFWYRKPPPRIVEIITLDKQKYLDRTLLINSGFEDCPKSELAATATAGISEINWQQPDRYYSGRMKTR